MDSPDQHVLFLRVTCCGQTSWSLPSPFERESVTWEASLQARGSNQIVGLSSEGVRCKPTIHSALAVRHFLDRPWNALHGNPLGGHSVPLIN